MSEASAESKTSPVLYNPWVYVPLLYFMQAIPVTIVQEVAAIFYKDLGIANEPIVRWTSLISLPWSMQLLFGPLVDLNSTKRNWILGGQFLIAIGLGATAFLLSVPFAFEITLVILGATAVTSALCNIATDGFYILSTTKEQQAKFVGVQTTCYRLGRLFCSGLLVLFVGLLTKYPAIPVDITNGVLVFKQSSTVQRKAAYGYARNANLAVKDGVIADAEKGALFPELKVPNGTFGLNLKDSGELFAFTPRGAEPIGRIEVAEVEVASRDVPTATTPAAPGQVSSTAPLVKGFSPTLSWTIILACAAGLYLLGHFANRITVPKPTDDQPAAEPVPGENQRNIQRTLVLVGVGLSGYFFLNALVRLVLHGVSTAMGTGKLEGWKLAAEAKVIGFNTGLSGPVTEIAQLLICGVILASGLTLAKRLIAGSLMGEALGSFIRQSGFPAILFFILFYRFGEAMVGKMSALFLKDTIEKGGLSIPNDQLGLMNGIAGVVGIVIGGLAGGYTVSKIGLRKAFWPLAFAMHVPNLMYVWASSGVRVPTEWIYGILFVDQFGYGFGFAGYMVYLMWVAQRGHFKTSHYAIGTGMGALCIATAGVVGGVIQANYGYHGFFIAVIFMSIPGLLALLFIPLDESHQKIKVEVD